MAAHQQKGPCYLCGQELTKGYMGRHLLSRHLDGAGDQPCYLLKITDEYGQYWLFVDIPLSSTLSTLDSFLRAVWLECCGHMSAFMRPGNYGDEVGMSKKISSFVPGDVLQYDYDFGDTTTLIITFAEKTVRPKQRIAVRVLARNSPYEFPCDQCGKPAEQVDRDKWPPEFLCRECAKKVDEEMLLPVVNSPRVGVCAYCGEYDHFAYVPKR